MYNVHRYLGSNVTKVFDSYTDYRKNIKTAEQRHYTIKTSSSSDAVSDRIMAIQIIQKFLLSFQF